MLYRPALIAGMLIPLAASFAAIANAQPLGSFSWQLQPFCNVLTISVTQQGNIYTLDGYDDQCGGRAESRWHDWFRIAHHHGAWRSRPQPRGAHHAAIIEWIVERQYRIQRNVRV